MGSSLPVADPGDRILWPASVFDLSDVGSTDGEEELSEVSEMGKMVEVGGSSLVTVGGWVKSGRERGTYSLMISLSCHRVARE